MKPKSVLRLVGLLPACAGACGCADALRSPYPAKAYFLVDPGSPVSRAIVDKGRTGMPGESESLGSNRTDNVLKVRQFRVAAPYNGSSFVYKVGSDQYSTDYYAAFLMSTDKMLTGETCDWLDRSGSFTHVIDSASTVRTRYSLEGNVSGLYGDFTKPQAPRGVVEIQFSLLQDGEAGQQILFAHTFSSSQPITLRGPAGLVDAWNRGYRKVLEELTADLPKHLTATGQASIPAGAGQETVSR